jgi:hypothetical protein
MPCVVSQLFGEEEAPEAPPVLTLTDPEHDVDEPLMVQVALQGSPATPGSPATLDTPQTPDPVVPMWTHDVFLPGTPAHSEDFVHAAPWGSLPM